MRFLDKITLRQLIILGMGIMIILAIAPAARMLFGLTQISEANRTISVSTLPLIRTTDRIRGMLLEIDAKQLRYLAETDNLKVPEAEIRKGFKVLSILVAKLRYGSESPDYKEIRAELKDPLPDDEVIVEAGSLTDKAMILDEFGRQIRGVENAFNALADAHNKKIAYLVKVNGELRPISAYAADMLIEFRVWVSALEQAAEFFVKFNGTVDPTEMLIGAVAANFKAIDLDMVQDLRNAQRIVTSMFSVAEIINAAEGERKYEIYRDQARIDHRRYEELLMSIVKKSNKAVGDALEAETRALHRFKILGEGIGDLGVSLDQDLNKVAQTAMKSAEESIASGINLSWIAMIAIAIVAPLAGFLLGYSIISPLGRIARATEAVSAGDTTMEIAGTRRRDEIGAMAKALQVFQSNMAETERLRLAQTEQERLAAIRKAEDMEQLAKSFEESVLSIVERVSSAANQMKTSAATVADAAQQTSGQTTYVASAANQTSINVRSVAVATEELSASVRDISTQTEDALALSEDATRKAQASADIMSGLDKSVSQIGDVVNVIHSIASQTNLLALNATIEAARAGEAGRGFAVVANEVKALAAQTASATQEISRQINAVQQAASTAVGTINEVNLAIPRIGELSMAIAGAMREQDGATREIAGNVEQAARGVEEVTSVITEVAQIAQMNGEASTGMLDAVDGLMEQSNALKSEVEGFLRHIRAA